MSRNASKELVKCLRSRLGDVVKSSATRHAERMVVSGLSSDRIKVVIAARDAARKAKNFKESDRIRDELAKMGVVLKDTKDGTTWEIAR